MENDEERTAPDDGQMSRTMTALYIIYYFLTFRGRMSRGVYWLSVIVMTAVIAAIGGIASLWGYDLSAAISEGTAAGTAVAIVYLWFLMAQTAKRMHDDGWAWPWMLIPIVNIVLILRDGEPYDNRYGADPKGRHEPVPEVPDISEFF